MHENGLLVAADRDQGPDPWPNAGHDPRVAAARRYDVGSRSNQAWTLPPELAALECAGFPPGPLYAALAEAERVGVEPFDALMASGVFPETELVETLARSLGVDVAAENDARGAPIDADTFALASTSGHLASIGTDGRPRFVVAARGREMHRLARARRGQIRTRSLALAGPRAFADLLVARAGSALAERAAEGSARTAPETTVAHGLPRPGPAARLAIGLGVAAALGAAAVFEALEAALLAFSCLVFAALNGFRMIVGAAFSRLEPAPFATGDDAALPVYTVLVALYREAAVVPSLLDAIERLDYPAAKLDVKLLTEADDLETRAALAARRPRAGVEVLVLPAGGPQTKPRALNAGLLAARGRYLAVFDAEDRPDPRQLRMAAERFRRASDELACLQARLAIDNHADGWLCRHFAIEYAALFDVILPALSALRLPIPLGGTSNHFRVEALRRVGGWDAGNVTEDAELGLRLASFGYRTATIPSVTWEEAPTRVRPWIKQRTRWMKGFMVTALLYARRPVRLGRALGPAGFLAAQLMVGGVALTALAYPVALAFLLYDGFSGELLAPAASLGEALLFGLLVANMILGFSSGLACGWIGVDRRCPPEFCTTLISLPVYWLLVGFAAWRAAWQLIRNDTTSWEKTTHGVSSRRATPAETPQGQM